MQLPLWLEDRAVLAFNFGKHARRHLGGGLQKGFVDQRSLDRVKKLNNAKDDSTLYQKMKINVKRSCCFLVVATRAFVWRRIGHDG